MIRRVGLATLAVMVGVAGSAWAGACARAAMYGGNSVYWNTMCVMDWLVDFLVS